MSENRKKKKSNVILIALIIFFAIALIVSAVMIARAFIVREEKSEELHDLGEAYTISYDDYLKRLEDDTDEGFVDSDTGEEYVPGSSKRNNNNPSGQGGYEDYSDETLESAPDFWEYHDMDGLKEENKDTFAWIMIKNTKVNYPVMLCRSEPERYLYQSFYSEYSINGTPFADYRCREDSDNIIIFGHNMANGSMFAAVKKYMKKSYMQSHKFIQFETSKGIGMYRVFAVVLTTKDDPWYSFVDADSREEFEEMTEYIQSKALYKTDIIPYYGNQILTLSTCYHATGDQRVLVLATEFK